MVRYLLYCRMTTTISLVNVHRHTGTHFLFLLMTAFKIHALGNLQIYNTVLFSTVTVLYVRAPFPTHRGEGITKPGDRGDEGCWLRSLGVQRSSALTRELCCPVQGLGVSQRKTTASRWTQGVCRDKSATSCKVSDLMARGTLHHILTCPLAGAWQRSSPGGPLSGTLCAALLLCMFAPLSRPVGVSTCVSAELHTQAYGADDREAVGVVKEN